MGEGPKRRRRDGKDRGVLALEGALSDWMKSIGLDRRLKHLEIGPVWVEVVGSEIARATEIRSLERNVLRVWVSSPPLLSELASFRKQEILDRLAAHPDCPRIVDIKFYLR